VGRLQLRKLDGFNESRRRIARWYSEGLRGIPVTIPQAKDWAEPVYHLYVIQTPDRDKLGDFLKEKGIQTGIHYPIPNHQQPAVRNALGQQPKLAKTEKMAKKILSLPIYPELEKEKAEFVCSAIREFFQSKN